MGNSSGKDKGEETVDGGQLVPNGVYKGTQDWDHRSVRKLIIERRLAPFYKGLSECESWDEVTLTTHNLPKSSEGKRSSTFTGECQAQGSRELKRATTLNAAAGANKGKEVSPTKSLETQLYKGAVECPICFLYYPQNINHSRCCDQPICTECFVQIKRPESGSLGANNSPAVCPFCVEPNFGVCYKPSSSFISGIGSENMIAIPNLNIPPLSTSSTLSLNVPDGKIRRKGISHKNSEVVTTDQIRPNWAAHTLQQPPRQPPGIRRPSIVPSGSSRRIVVRSQGGSGNTYVTSSTATPPRRANPPAGTTEYGGGYFAAMRVGTDLEELMVMEAIRLSLMEQDENDRRERGETDRIDNNTSSSENSTTDTITIPHLPSNDEVSLVESQRIDDNIYSEIGAHFSRQTPLDLIDYEEEDESSSTSHSNDYTPTTVSTPITTTSTDDGTIMSVSVQSSSTGSGLSSTSSTTNSTSDVIVITQSSSPNTRNINNITTTEITSAASGSSLVVPTQYDEQEQTSDIKKPTVIILQNSSLADESIVRNERDGS